MLAETLQRYYRIIHVFHISRISHCISCISYYTYYTFEKRPAKFKKSYTIVTEAFSESTI